MRLECIYVIGTFVSISIYMTVELVTMLWSQFRQTLYQYQVLISAVIAVIYKSHLKFPRPWTT